MINVVSYKWGNRYPVRYWNVLKKATDRNLSLPHRFFVICDDANGLNPDIEAIKMNMSEDFFAMWTKMTIFRPEPFGISGRILLLDADTLITGKLDEVGELEGDFYTYPSWWDPVYAFSVALLNDGCRSILWDEFIKDVKGNIQKYKRDEFFIKHFCQNEEFFPREWVRSYIDCSSYKGTTGKLPAGCKFVCFHGKPDPHEVISSTFMNYGPDPWIADYWKP